ncbi:orotate phosphoribosyltransferase [Treponema pedis]|uniref:Orotate phosphoribosyltransferase n=2 Tax=Treponema pedis TaxID=409322 RepID=A0A7S6WMR9_9SPIR|nr:orotate phosphoribosyltransferase [Treponema pedis]QOW59952.1 orotate phosphoribosyltransferase [Treponema pedis]
MNLFTEKINSVQKKYGAKLAQQAFKLGAIKLSPEEPFTWASGYRMPIYNDNRRFLSVPELRLYIAEAFTELLKAVDFNPDWLAGTATAGIPHAVTLADLLKKPVSYVRSSGKDHGLKNLIEGLGANADYGKTSVLVIEDLISTGGSSIKAVEAVRLANGTVPFCFAIFSYGFEEAEKAFSELKPACIPVTVLNYNLMLDEALKENYISGTEKKSLSEWREAPFEWGEKRGFYKVK